MKKSLHYGYPTSPISKKYQLYNEGVWYVSIGTKVLVTFPGNCIDSRWRALEYFEALQNEVDIHNSFTRESLPFKDHE